MEERVLEIIGEVLNVPIEQLDLESSWDTIPDWDSIGHMNLILTLEEELDISFLDEEIVELRSVALIIKALKKRDSAIK